MNQLPETIGCPYCGNVNPYLQENCVKCKKPLGPIRAAMDSATEVEQPKQTQTSPTAIEPPPPMPSLPKGSVNDYKNIDRNSFLIRNAGDRGIEIAARFFKRLNEKNLEKVSFSTGVLGVDIGSGKRETRDYYFVRKDIDAYTFLLMAVRIASSGPDLYVEWRNLYYRKPPYNWLWWIILIVGVLLMAAVGLANGSESLNEEISGWLYGISLLAFTVGFGGGMIYHQSYTNKKKLIGFQIQENEIFQLSVRATLEEAIDLAGISKSMIQRDLGKDDRVI
jgi:hypothetical protein